MNVVTNAQHWHEDDTEEEMRQYLFSDELDDRPEVVIEVPEWKRHVLIKAMSGTQRSAFINWQNGLPQPDEHRNRRTNFYLVSTCCLHPKTQKPFLKPADEQMFMSKRNGAVIETLAYTVMQISRIDGSTMEQARKNLGAVNDTATTN